MCDPHGGVGLVDVLTPGPAGPIRVDLEVVILDAHVCDLIHHRRDLHPGEAGVPAMGGVEGRQADQTVNPLLAGVQPVGVLASDQERRGLDPRLLPRRDLQQLHSEPALLSPAHLHAQQHLRPVLGVGAARAGIDGDQRVARVVATGEHALLLQLGQALLHRAHLLLQLALQLWILLGQLSQRLQIGHV